MGTNRTFTQAEVDEIVANRVRRERYKLLRIVIKMIAGLQDLCKELQ